MSKSILVAILVLLVAVAQAQTPPNLTGLWKCNMEKSDWGTSTPPPDLAIQIKHRNPEMALTQIVSGQTEEFRFTTDGKENVNNFSEGTLRSTLKWEKNVLVVSSKLEGADVTISDRLTLLPDGKTLKVTRHMTSPNGERNWVLILDKQSESKPKP